MQRLNLKRISPGPRIIAGLLLVGLLVSWQQQLFGADQVYLEKLRTRPHQKGVLMRFEGPIGGMLPQYLSRQLQRARKANADLIVVEIDSPGGELEASFACAELLKSVNWADLVVFVPKQAYSGAAITALGAKTIVVAPSAKFGDAGPIFMDENAMFRHAPEKFRSALAGRIRELAESTGRPGTLAHAMVDLDWVVYHVKHRVTNQETWMSEEEIQGQKEPGQWEKLSKVDESREEYFLTVSGKRAVELTLADFLCESREQLRKELHLADGWIVAKPNWVDQTIIILNTRFVTGLLFVIGIIALFVEFSAPGISVGGLTSGLCFTLFVVCRFLGGTAGWLEVMLFGLGILFLLLGIFVIPGFGVAGLLLALAPSSYVVIHKAQSEEAARGLEAIPGQAKVSYFLDRSKNRLNELRGDLDFHKEELSLNKRLEQVKKGKYDAMVISTAYLSAFKNRKVIPEKDSNASEYYALSKLSESGNVAKDENGKLLDSGLVAAPIEVREKDFLKIIIYLFIVGVSAGMYITPLQALLQKLSPEDSRGQYIAASNAIDTILEVVAIGLFFLLRNIGAGSQEIFFLVSGLAAMAIVLFVIRIQPQIHKPEWS